MAEEYRIDGWHLDKRISAGHLLTTLAIIVSFVTWMLRMETQLAAVQALTISNTERIEQVEQSSGQRSARIELAMESHYTEIIRRMERVEALLIQHMSPASKKHE